MSPTMDFRLPSQSFPFAPLTRSAAELLLLLWPGTLWRRGCQSISTAPEWEESLGALNPAVVFKLFDHPCACCLQRQPHKMSPESAATGTPLKPGWVLM